ncbi:rhodanese-like domain-containing protein [Actinomadura xylanilytica]|uniref:rhodanese-like domain-containing protein n=1 Tax=Actinomadura xylanilytica TaxID=887459 RepID=UPI00255A85CD|nr:rhodanese-like domain-containing protein [Actinomadura xylanilytica]MDL4770760.1 rhodanese-like domain-containing protein [Actinomadura xylanilytica]
MTSTPNLDVSAAQALLHGDPAIQVVDVRTPAEYAAVHIPGALNLSLDQIETHPQRITAAAAGPILLVCQTGGRATRAYGVLTGAGLDQAQILAGGMNAWTAAAGPTTRLDGRPRWGLERQVRLVAGGIVASSIAASLRWPRARFLAGAIGAGLAFAAVTDTCAMGMALAKLPYNRGPRFDLDHSLAKLRSRGTGGESQERA